MQLQKDMKQTFSNLSVSVRRRFGLHLVDLAILLTSWCYCNVQETWQNNERDQNIQSSINVIDRDHASRRKLVKARHKLF